MVTTLKQGTSKKNLQELFNSLVKNVQKDGVNTLKYCGKLKLKEDALKIQQKMRNDWK